MVFAGCSKSKDNKNNNANTQDKIEVQSGYSNDKKTYTIQSDNVYDTKDNISIKIPEKVTALEDADSNKDTYISLYNVGDSGVATTDDYVLTYSVINKDEIEEDLNNTVNLYKDMYRNFESSQIQDGTTGNINYRYYTVSYTSGDTKLTDYTIQFNIDNAYVLTKVGTTFYPLDMTLDEIVNLALDNIER